MTTLGQENIDQKALLEWHIAMGADEATDLEPVNRFVAPPPPAATIETKAHATPKPAPGPTPVAARPAQPTRGAGAEEATRVANSCNTAEELKVALEAFDGGLLKRSAKNTIFADGTFGAPLMVIGDVPGREDDQEGTPFAGPSGMLLDKMLRAIGLSRNENAYLSTVLPWRPLGNSKPDAGLLAVCKPFIERHIQLAKPKVVLGMGGALGKALFETQDSISRQRGRWQELSSGGQTFALIATYHPVYLMSQPHQKGVAWQDLLTVKEKLSS